MQKIQSFAEAKQRLDEIESAVSDLRHFMDKAYNAIAAVDMLKGGHITVVQKLELEKNGATSSWADRVLDVFRMVGKPMMQKEAMKQYERTGLPAPEDRKELYRQISGAVAYLANRKGLLVKTPEGYKLKE